MRITTISSKRQITIPQAMLKSFDIYPTNQVILEKRNNEISIRPLKFSIARELAGCLTPLVDPSKLGVPFDKIMEITKKKVAKQLAAKK